MKKKLKELSIIYIYLVAEIMQIDNNNNGRFDKNTSLMRQHYISEIIDIRKKIEPFFKKVYGHGNHVYGLLDEYFKSLDDQAKCYLEDLTSKKRKKSND